METYTQIQSQLHELNEELAVLEWDMQQAFDAGLEDDMAYIRQHKQLVLAEEHRLWCLARQQEPDTSIPNTWTL